MHCQSFICRFPHHEQGFSTKHTLVGKNEVLIVKASFYHRVFQGGLMYKLDHVILSIALQSLRVVFLVTCRWFTQNW